MKSIVRVDEAPLEKDIAMRVRVFSYGCFAISDDTCLTLLCAR
ncbi:MAG: hypothetical protein NTZ48_07390 [Candidatus Omnitrophica bacterium]|nr:hypothetical protein [Candidatus Omnitrophota bacterium]